MTEIIHCLNSSFPYPMNHFSGFHYYGFASLVTVYLLKISNIIVYCFQNEIIFITNIRLEIGISG